MNAPILKFLAAGFLAAGPLLAGSSLQLSSKSVLAPLPASPSNRPWRVEFYLHDWVDRPAQGTKIVESSALGLSAYFSGTEQVNMLLYNTRERGGSELCSFSVSGLPGKGVYVRFQHDPASKTDTCEAWDNQGRRFYSIRSSYTSELDGSPGFSVGSTWGDERYYGFVRLHNKLVAMNSRIPVVADDADTALNWKFEGNLDDSSASRLHGSYSEGTPVFVTTPPQAPRAVIQTAGAPIWSNWVSLRAGYPNTLNGNGSYSQADASAAVTCFWQQLSGPSQLTWRSRNSCTPTVTGVVFGDYHIELTVTDTAGQTVATAQHIGAVAYNDKGVVIPPDPAVTTIFGPMIAFGKNPWGYMDERNLALVAAQQASLDTAWPAQPAWSVAGAGTVSYRSDGGWGSQTVLNGAGIGGATVASIPVADAGKLNLTTLPAWIMVGSYGGNRELIRVCSTTGTSGAQILTACYDGRGISVSLPGGTNSYTVAAQAWPAGTAVFQHKITGSGTSFASDPNTALCPAGVPGPPGAVAYATGTAALAGGSTAVTGSGTEWESSMAGKVLRVQATHDGGVSFVFWSRIATVTDATHLTLDRAFPASGDGGSYSYKIVTPRYAALGFVAVDGVEQLGYHALHGCESETAAFGASSIELSGAAAVQTGRTYSYLDNTGVNSVWGVNFYGAGLALRAFYYRSGLQQALDLANRIDDLWAKHPENGGGWLGGLTLLRGGGVIGAIANVALNPAAKIGWQHVRGFVQSTSSVATSGCDDWDTRDSSYPEGWTALAALLDPDPAKKAQWKALLQQYNTRDNNCRSRGISGLASESNSWAHGFIWSNSQTPRLTVTQGSAVVRGTGIPTTACAGIASGSVTMTNGSAAFTGSGLVNGQSIVITGSKSGQPFVGWYEFTQSGGTAGSLSNVWLGDSGAATYIIQSDLNFGAFGTSPTDPQLTKNWACIWNSSTQITLNRAWDGPTNSATYGVRLNQAGYGQQPFMLGIKTTAMKWASALDGELGTSFGTNAALAGEWYRNYGYDPEIKGTAYGRVFGGCEPPAPRAGNFGYSQLGCGFGFGPGSVAAGRVNSAEASSLVRCAYEANPSQAARDWGDVAYGAIWGYAAYTQPGFYTDADYNQWEMRNASLGGAKWPGFFFGVGMAHQWPAVRTGAGSAVEMRPLVVNLRPDAIPNAVRWRLHLTLASGAKVVQNCLSSPCVANVDVRQGGVLAKWSYLDAGQKVIGESDEFVVGIE